MLLPSDIPEDLVYILQGMREDDIGLVTKKDSLILAFGRNLAAKHGKEKEMFGYIRSQMRHLAILY